MRPGRVSVIVSTYNQPRALERVLWGYAVQTHRDFELIVADDGSRADTAELVEAVRRDASLDLHHVWHADDGFRKTEILNRAILAAGGEYCIFTDGDCIPREDFVATHVRLAAPRTFLSGGYLKLPAAVSERVTVADVVAGRVADPTWLRAHGWRPGRRALRLLRAPTAASALDWLTPTGATWNGHNASTWRDALLAVNGFDLDMRYGGEDRALGERLVNLGYRGRQIRFRAPCLHLDHARPYMDAAGIRANQAVRERIRRNRETRARLGIEELPPETARG